MSVWTAVWRDADGATRMEEVESPSRPGAYQALAAKGIRPVNVIEGSLKKGGSARARRARTSGDGGRLAFLLAVLILVAAGAVVWYRWIGPARQAQVRERLRPPGKVTIRLSEP